MILTSIPFWQLIIIPGIIAGIFNRSIKFGILSGFLAVSSTWSIYLLHGIITRNVYSTLELFGGLLVGEGFGWLIIVIIILMGALFGALGGGIGSALSFLLKDYVVKIISKMSNSEKREKT